MELPKELLERHGKIGEGIYKKGYKDGKMDGQKVAQSDFAKETNGIVNSILKAKTKENYKAPTATDVNSKFGSVFKFDGGEPDRSAIKGLALTVLKFLESKPIPPKKSKEKPPTP